MLMGLPTHRKKHQDSIVSLFWAEFYSCYSPSACSAVCCHTSQSAIKLYYIVSCIRTLEQCTSILHAIVAYIFYIYYEPPNSAALLLLYTVNYLFYQSAIFLKNTFYLLKHLSLLVLFIPLCRSKFLPGNSVLLLKNFL